MRILARLEQLDGAVVGGAVDHDVLMGSPERRHAVEGVRQEARHVARGVITESRVIGAFGLSLPRYAAAGGSPTELGFLITMIAWRA